MKLESKLDLKFTQVCGSKASFEEVKEEDIISCLEFDKRGKLISLGDAAGRLIIFKKNNRKKNNKGVLEYVYMTELQSHIEEFDRLTSKSIQEKITAIEWLQQEGRNNFVISSNEKKIKLWKISNKVIKKVKGVNYNNLSKDNFKMPELEPVDTEYYPSLKRVYNKFHSFHINSVSANPNQMNFISSDDLKINYWDIEQKNTTFCLVDIAPKDIQNVEEVITSAKFNPASDFQFIYGTSKGYVNLIDMRLNSKSKAPAMKFFDDSLNARKNIFTDILNSVGDCKVSPDGNFIYTRHFLQTKIWDIKQDKEPLKTIKLFEPLKGKLCDIYNMYDQKKCSIDKFKISVSPCSNYFISGMFDNRFHIGNKSSDINLQYQLNFKKKTNFKSIPPENYYEALGPDFNLEKKTLLTSWNPQQNCVAIACLNCLFFYNA